MGQRFCKKTALFSGAALLLLTAVPGVLLAVLLKLPAPKKLWCRQWNSGKNGNLYYSN